MCGQKSPLLVLVKKNKVRPADNYLQISAAFLGIFSMLPNFVQIPD